MESFQLVLIDGDLWRDSYVLAHDLGLLQATGETEKLPGLGEPSQQSLELLLRVCCDDCIIREQHVLDGGLSFLGFGSNPGQVENSPIRPVVEVNAFCCIAECMAQEESEKDPEECWGKYASLLYSAAYVEAF